MLGHFLWNFGLFASLEHDTAEVHLRAYASLNSCLMCEAMGNAV